MAISPTQKWYLAAGGASLAVLTAGWFLLVSPQQSSTASRSVQRSRLRRRWAIVPTHRSGLSVTTRTTGSDAGCRATCHASPWDRHDSPRRRLPPISPR